MKKNNSQYRYLSVLNADYIEKLYEDFCQKDPNLPKDWKFFFEGVEFAFQTTKRSQNAKEVFVEQLLQAYRDDGHLKAHLDPLSLRKRQDSLFDLEKFSLENKDLKKVFKSKTLSSLIAHMEKTYCGCLTVHVSHCTSEIRKWFYEQMEEEKIPSLSDDEKKSSLKHLINAHTFEQFLHTRFVGAKRFSIEGCDALLPMLFYLLKQTETFKINEMVIGMAHRGRLTVLANFLEKNLEAILSYFEGYQEKEENFEGDVKYHLGYSTDLKTKNKSCHISLCFNPSHLESVYPVVLGMVRAKQRFLKDTEERRKVLPLVIHGDAAFAAQGVVSESLQLSKLEGYTVGGTLHILINNQIGFTTFPEEGRSTLYSSDIAKSIKAPVILVNGDDTEASLKAIYLAIKFRTLFKQDVVIDLHGYRRYGHNEGDEPSFSQPKMYNVIKTHPPLKTVYSQKLMTEKLVTLEETKEYEKEKNKEFQTVLDKVRQKPQDFKIQSLEGRWKKLRKAKVKDFEKSYEKTSCPIETLDKVHLALFNIPQNFNLHPKVKRLIEARKQMYEGKKIDWGLAELLAYGSLCLENYPVRLTGQDSKRGTFSHRHAVYFDTKSNEAYSPLSHICVDQAEFCIYNSPLSEMAVLGFEYGNSSSDPDFLTLWEAQFGDFANGAQIIIDQFISSGESKWGKMSSLTLLLPHGYEGLGPEHSSARIERFLQLCAQENIQVCNITTPSNFFHALRRQVKRDFRKPLIIASPKSLLRHPQVISPLDEFTQSHFQEILSDPLVTDEKQISELILCSGKIYYEIQEQRKKEHSHKAVVRLEQLYPFPKIQLTPFLNGYPKLQKLTWIQEEPQNMGAYSFIKPLLFKYLKDLGRSIDLNYVGRPKKASPATGSSLIHAQEQRQIVKDALG